MVHLIYLFKFIVFFQIKKKRLIKIHVELYGDDTETALQHLRVGDYSMEIISVGLNPMEYYASKFLANTTGDQISSMQAQGLVSRQETKRKLAIANEMTAYMEMPLENVAAKDLLLWWKTASKTIPMLAKLSRYVYSMPASSAGVESQFSTTGIGGIVTNRRNALSKSTVEDILMVHDNRDIREKLLKNSLK